MKTGPATCFIFVEILRVAVVVPSVRVTTVAAEPPKAGAVGGALPKSFCIAA
jgi:hypothetical protein